MHKARAFEISQTTGSVYITGYIYFFRYNCTYGFHLFTLTEGKRFPPLYVYTVDILYLADFDLLGSPLPVGKDEVVEADLAAEEVGHVHLVGVQRAEENLKTSSLDVHNENIQTTNIKRQHVVFIEITK